MRKTTELTIQGDPNNRDNGKKFIITEMAAIPAEAWAQRAVGAMVRAGFKPPTGAESITGMAAMASFGTASFLAAPWPEIEPLLAEMLACVQIKEELLQVPRPLTPDDIEEITTLILLREEAIKLHTGFSLAANLLAAVAQFMAAKEEEEDSSDTPTPPISSEMRLAPLLSPSMSARRSTPWKICTSS